MQSPANLSSSTEENLNNVRGGNVTYQHIAVAQMQHVMSVFFVGAAALDRGTARKLHQVTNCQSQAMYAISALRTITHW